MKFETRYEVRREDINERIAEQWSINKGSDAAYFLCRITRVAGSQPEEWVDCTRVAVFSLDSEARVFQMYLEDLHPRGGSK